MEKQLPDTVTQSYVGLSGPKLVEWALDVGETCLEDIGSVQKRYFQTLARNAGVEWPDGFFASSVKELMDNRF
jgi:hypothetical protein